MSSTDSPKALNCTELTLIRMGFAKDSIIRVFGAVYDTNGQLLTVGDYVRVDENRVCYLNYHNNTLHKTHYINLQVYFKYIWGVGGVF